MWYEPSSLRLVWSTIYLLVRIVTIAPNSVKRKMSIEMDEGNRAISELEKELDMRFMKNRLASFKDWPFEENCACTPEKMAECGFFHCPTENEPDLVKCYVCLKELDGWTPEDIPWLEHKNHSSKCPFLEYCNPDNPKKITVENFLKLEKDRHINFVRKQYAILLDEITLYATEARKQMEMLVSDD